MLTRAETLRALADLLEAESRLGGRDPGTFALDDEAANAFFDSVDPDQSNSIDRSEFVAAAVAIKGSFKVFTSFLDHQKAQSQGRISLDFKSLVYALAHIQ